MLQRETRRVVAVEMPDDAFYERDREAAEAGLPSTVHEGQLAVWSRFPMRELGDLELKPARVMRVGVDAPGMPFVLYVVHSLNPLGDTSFADQRRFTDELLAAIGDEERPVVVAGDFNMSDRVLSYRMMDDALTDAMRAGSAGRTTYVAGWWTPRCCASTTSSSSRRGVRRRGHLRDGRLRSPRRRGRGRPLCLNLCSGPDRPVVRVTPLHARAMRHARIEPTGTQESVWDYPRPPALVPEARRIVVTFGGVTIADTTRALRILETSHPPTFYLPLDDVRGDLLRAAEGASFCEWKGAAASSTWSSATGWPRQAGWHYPAPAHRYAILRDHVAFYAGRVDRCTVGGIEVTPQPGGLLRRVDHARRRRPVQGGAGHAKLVNAEGRGDPRPSRSSERLQDARARSGTPRRRRTRRACRSGSAPPSRACSRR